MDRMPAVDRPDVEVCSPATGLEVARVPDEGREGAAAAVARARASAPGWAALSAHERIRALKRWRDAVLDHSELVVDTLVAESGKPRHEAEGIELLYFCELIRFMCRALPRALRDEVRRPFLFVTKSTRLVRHPLGVVGVIGPWNFPILNNAADAVAPLLAGNTVVLKPSEITPTTSVLLGRLWLHAGNPAGVFEVVTGRGETGAALVDLVDGVMFTGSVATGRRVAARAGERLIPCVTELGGKSPLIVLEGADLDRAAEAATWSSFIHSGQVCVRTERIFVEDAVADAFERKLGDRVSRLRQGPPAGEPHDLGAVTFARQLDVVSRHIDDAVAKGARVLTGGARTSETGSFFAPTVLAGARADMDVMREETFGPLVPVMRVADADEAVRLANESHLGLNASVFGPERAARRVAERLDTGNVIVNDVLVNYFIVEAPLGGWKESGVGARHGAEALRQWTRVKAITVSRLGFSFVGRVLASQLAFPYDPRVLRLLRHAMRFLYGSGLARKLGKR